jgi:hypothetical protein
VNCICRCGRGWLAFIHFMMSAGRGSWLATAPSTESGVVSKRRSGLPRAPWPLARQFMAGGHSDSKRLHVRAKVAHALHPCAPAPAHRRCRSARRALRPQRRLDVVRSTSVGSSSGGNQSTEAAPSPGLCLKREMPLALAVGRGEPRMLLWPHPQGDFPKRSKLSAQNQSNKAQAAQQNVPRRRRRRRRERTQDVKETHDASAAHLPC